MIGWKQVVYVESIKCVVFSSTTIIHEMSGNKCRKGDILSTLVTDQIKLFIALSGMKLTCFCKFWGNFKFVFITAFSISFLQALKSTQFVYFIIIIIISCVKLTQNSYKIWCNFHSNANFLKVYMHHHKIWRKVCIFFLHIHEKET
jgi:hypothetical protein